MYLNFKCQVAIHLLALAYQTLEIMENCLLDHNNIRGNMSKMVSHWLQGHSDTKDNEAADYIVKAGDREALSTLDP